MVVTIFSVDFEYTNYLVSDVKIKGSDKLGSWEGLGQYILTKRGPLFWMLKVYDNKEKAGQTGRWNTLIYESTSLGKKIKGKWFYENFQEDKNYSGKWSIH